MGAVQRKFALQIQALFSPTLVLWPRLSPLHEYVEAAERSAGTHPVLVAHAQVRVAIAPNIARYPAMSR
jgi:hypothetical protein